MTFEPSLSYEIPPFHQGIVGSLWLIATTVTDRINKLSQN